MEQCMYVVHCVTLKVFFFFATSLEASKLGLSKTMIVDDGPVR